MNLLVSVSPFRFLPDLSPLLLLLLVSFSGARKEGGSKNAPSVIADAYVPTFMFVFHQTMT